nr:hypothetical protein BaRGS_008279 [Batillaria attramentaria]
MRVDILAIKNGAKKLSAECPLPTDETNYKADCCHYSEGDCLIESINTFPMECHEVRITGGKPPQSSVWDFLLANTMSVRAFRGYDNFSSTRTTASHSSEESGSPVIRKTVWLPNISLDSGHGDTVVTSDDNCSIFTTDGTLPSTSNRL